MSMSNESANQAARIAGALSCLLVAGCAGAPPQAPAHQNAKGRVIVEKK